MTDQQIISLLEKSRFRNDNNPNLLEVCSEIVSKIERPIELRQITTSDDYFFDVSFSTTWRGGFELFDYYNTP